MYWHITPCPKTHLKALGITHWEKCVMGGFTRWHHLVSADDADDDDCRSVRWSLRDSCRSSQSGVFGSFQSVLIGFSWEFWLDQKTHLSSLDFVFRGIVVLEGEPSVWGPEHDQVFIILAVGASFWCFLVSFTEQRLPHGHSVIRLQTAECCSDCWPSGIFSRLHTGTPKCLLLS